MKLNFDTSSEKHAKAALLLYVVYRSRDKGKFKVTPEMWGQIERFVKASAKRAASLAAFVDSLKPRLSCAAISPRWMDVGVTSRLVGVGDGQFAEFQNQDSREFMTRIFDEENQHEVINVLYKETTLVVLLVRDRIEREKPIEQRLYDAEDESA